MDTIENKQTSVSSTNNTERWGILGMFIYPFIGGIFLFAGISSIASSLSEK